MLSYFLAIAIATISVGLYLTAFLSPKIHRQDDFLWSGLGLFYALILWLCAGRITGALLLGQLAVTSMIVAFIWETRQLRKLVTEQENSLKLEGISILDLILSLLSKLPIITQKQSTIAKTPAPQNQTQPIPDKTPSEELINLETKEVKDTEEISLTNIADSMPTKEKENQNLSAKTDIDSQKQQEILDDNIPTPIQEIETKESITTSETLETENQQISDFPLDNDLEIETETETPAPIEIKPNSENKAQPEKKGFFGQLLGILTKPFGAKSPQPSSLNNQVDEFETEESELIVTLESDLNISSQENAKEIEEAINNLDIETLQTQPIDKANFDLESTENITVESISSIKIDKDTDSYEILDAIENEEENLEKTDFELEFEEESNSEIELELGTLNIESTSLSQGIQEIEFSNDTNFNENSDGYLDDMDYLVETTQEISETENPSLDKVPEEDKISRLTDLIEDETLSKELNEILEESNLENNEDFTEKK